MSEVALPRERGSGDSGRFLHQRGLRDLVNHQECLGRDFLLAGARQAPRFCGLALGKQLLFVLSSNYLSKQKATVMGRKVQFFQGLPVLHPFSQRAF